MHELLWTGLLALALASLGGLWMPPGTRGPFGWTVRFVGGGAACAALLFPLSVLVPKHALVAIAAVLAGALLLAAARRVVARLPNRDAIDGATAPLDPRSILLLAAIAAAVLAFTVLDLRHPLWWDGFQIWASKAQRLVVEGGLGREWYAGDVYNRRLLTYPPLVPMLEGLLSLSRRGFDFDALKPIFLLFYAALLVSTYAAASSRLSRRAALLATLLVAVVPGLSTRSAAGGYADMPVAAIVAATVAASLRPRDAGALPWMIGALTVVKNEGLILAAIACLAVAASWVLADRHRAARRLVAHARGIAVVAAFVAARLAYLAWLAVDDPNFRSITAPGSLAESRRRILHVGRLCVESALDVSRWGLLWPALAVAVVYLLRRSCVRERCLAAGVSAALVAWWAIFLQTNWPLELHVAQALPRLLAQLAPAAILLVMFAAARALGWPYHPSEVP